MLSPLLASARRVKPLSEILAETTDIYTLATYIDWCKKREKRDGDRKREGWYLKRLNQEIGDIQSFTFRFSMRFLFSK